MQTPPRMITYSDAQRAAITTHDRPVAVVAGAGSGKTFVLVERYLALLEQHRISEIAAITFTNKAAREMRNRVREGVIARVQAAGDSPDGAADSARERWERHLAGIDSARIETIHALCGTILRANAAAARVDPDFDVLQEEDAALLRDDALNAALDSFGAAGDPALALFAEYGESRVREALLIRLARDPLLLPAGDLLTHWMAAWEADAAPILRPLIDSGIGVELARKLAPPLPPDDALAEVLALQQSALLHLSTRDSADIIGWWRVLKPFSALPLNKGSQKNWDKARLAAIRDLIRECRAIESLDPPPDAPNDARAAELLPLWARADAAIRATYAELKNQRAALDFNDLERLTRDLLTTQPDIRARYHAEYAHLLVDEFQDTNPAQWDIIRALLPDTTRGLFVVGDPKQSIYAFRGADVTVFADARDLIGARGGIEVDLAESYRTHKRLIDRFNDIFGGLLVRESPEARYQVEYGTNMGSSRPAPDDLPAIYMDIGVYPHGGDGTSDERSDDRRRREGERIAAWIAARVAEGRPIYDKSSGGYRPIDYGDCAVLFRRMTNVIVYEEAFKAAGIPYVTIAGRGFYDRQEVWDILNALRALTDPTDELALAAALRSPLFNFSDAALYALRLPDTESASDSARRPLWDAIMQPPPALPESARAPVAFAAHTLRDMRALAGRLAIADLLDTLVTRTGYRAALSALPDGARRRGNIDKLIDKARASGRITLGAFTRYLGDLSARELREGEAALDASGAVQLMTIHTSKGLEFGAVALADAGSEGKSRDGAMVMDDPIACKVYDADTDKFVDTSAIRMANTRAAAREDAESRRLLYVAATRAADTLLISGQIKTTKDGSAAKSWLGWLCDALGVDTKTLPLNDTVMALEGAAGVVVTGYQAEGEDGAGDPTINMKVNAPANALNRDAALHPPTAPPALLAHVPPARISRAYALTATQIADLGCAFDIDDERERRYYRERWRRAVFGDAPSRIETIQAAPSRISARVLGEVVHRALRWWQRDLSEAEWKESLDAYAWAEGILDEAARDSLVKRALSLLQLVTSTPLHRRIERAPEVYRELPFVYETEARQIAGVIDVLMRTNEGRWQIVDYKTASVLKWMPLEQHARRYHIQVGLYAAAAGQLLAAQGEVAKPSLDVYIHYIRYAQSVHIGTDAWQSALERLEPCIGALINED
jgi:ATP-dependent helicase/nuclease subunit A